MLVGTDESCPVPDDPVLAESFVRNVQLINRHHLVLVNMIAPLGVGPLFKNNDVQSTEDIYSKLSGHLRWHDLRELERVLHRGGVTLSMIDNARLSADLVTQYVNVKQRQIL